MKTAWIAGSSFIGGAVIATVLTRLFMGSDGKMSMPVSAEASAPAAFADSRKPGLVSSNRNDIDATESSKMAARFAEVFSTTESSGKSMGELWWLLEHVPLEQIPELARRAAKAYRRPEQERAFAAIFSRWAEVDPKAAAEFVRMAPEKNSYRTPAINGLADRWSEIDPDGALDWAQHLPDTDFRKKWVIESVLQKMAKVDPEEAIEVATRRGADPDTLGKYLRDWVDHDPGAALTWLSNQPEGAARDRMIVLAVGRAVNPQNAVEIIQLVQSPQQQDRLLQQTALTWSLRDPAGVRQWMDAQTDPVVKAAILKGYANVLAQTDPAASASLFGRVAPGEDRSRLGAAIVANWYDRDPSAARAWAQSLPEDLRYEPMMGVFAKWLPNDPDAALRWLDTQPMSPDLRDKALTVSGVMMVDKNPKEAIRRAQSIARGDLRRGTLEEIVTRWAQYAPEAAQAWVQDSALSPEMKRRLDKRLKR